MMFVPHRRIVAEYEKTIAQMIGEFKPSVLLVAVTIFPPQLLPFAALAHLQNKLYKELVCPTPLLLISKSEVFFSLLT